MTEVKVDDRALKKAIRLLGEDLKALQIGVLPEDAGKEHSEGVTVGEVAVYNEYGTEDIPARSWLFDFIDENVKEISTQLAADTMRLVNDPEATQESVLKKRGIEYVRRIVRRMKNSIPPPNAPATLRRKRGTTTLIDTTKLISFIKFKVV